MKLLLPLNTLWLAPALAIFALVLASHPSAFIVRETGFAGNACGPGIPGQFSAVHGDWVCSSELTPGTAP